MLQLFTPVDLNITRARSNLLRAVNLCILCIKCEVMIKERKTTYFSMEHGGLKLASANGNVQT